MAIELGALALAIRDTGGDALLAKLKQVDQAATALGAKSVGPNVPPANQAKIERLTRGIQEAAAAVNVLDKAEVAAFRNGIAETERYIVKLGATDAELGRVGQAAATLQARVVASEQAKQAAVSRTTTAVRSQELAFFNAGGRIQTLGTKGFTALNALAFGLSQFASGAEVSFRSLATGIGSFTAFLGPEGAIASIALTTGLALYDFFHRTQKGIAETAQKAVEAAQQVKQELDALQNSGDVSGLIGRARTIEQGTASEGFANSLAAMRATAAATLNDLVAARVKLTAAENNLSQFFGPQRAIAEREHAAALLASAQAAAAVGRAEAQINDLRRRAINIGEPAQERGFGAIKITAEKAATQKDLNKSLGEEVRALDTIAKLYKVTLPDLQRAAELQTLMQAELAKGNATLVRRAELLQQLNTLSATGLTLETLKVRSITQGARLEAASKITINPKSAAELRIPVPRKPLTEFQEQLAQGLTNAIVTGLASGFARGLADGGIGEGFKQLGAEMLAGLGQVFLAVGEKAILGSGLIQGIVKSLASLNPWVAVAAGVALLSLARAMGAHAGSAGGAGAFVAGGGPSTSDAIRRLITDPNANRGRLPPSAQPGTGRVASLPPSQTIQVIGVQSAQGQRLIGESNARFTRRGG